MSTTTEMNERDYLASEVERARGYLAEHSDLPPVAQDAYNDFIRLTECRIEEATTTGVAYSEAADFYVAPGWAMVEVLGITAETTDDELNAIAAAEFQMAREQGQIVSGIFSYLRDLRDGLKS